jgi:DNA-directed RNA polymerase subunit RPC12/RpoP
MKKDDIPVKPVAPNNRIIRDGYNGVDQNKCNHKSLLFLHTCKYCGKDLSNKAEDKMKEKFGLKCQSCGKEENFETADQAFQIGWDFPPRIPVTTCPKCPSASILFCKLVNNK